MNFDLALRSSPRYCGQNRSYQNIIISHSKLYGLRRRTIKEQTQKQCHVPSKIFCSICPRFQFMEDDHIQPSRACMLLVGIGVIIHYINLGAIH